jgi:tetratricopeptide (TPR) repeat protein
MNRFRQVLQEGVRLASHGKADEALSQFNKALKLNIKKDDERWVCLIHKNIGLIHERNGNLRKAKRSYLDALKYCDADAYTYFSLGDLCERLVERNAARKYFSRSRELAVHTKDQDLLDMLLKRGYK